MSSEIRISIGICAYNEEGNIERSIRSLYEQEEDGFEIADVIVISSGSTDRTDDIVTELLPEFKNLRFLPQDNREGKNSAINYFLDNKEAPIAVLLNADNVFSDERSLANLIRPFSDPKVGIVGGHPIPTNMDDSIACFASNLLWSMHHHLSLVCPKIGELVAFRDIGTRLPKKSQSDEDILRMKLEEAGYIGAYAPDAVIFNRGPETVSDFIKQRTRVNIGELYMKKVYGYDIPTWDKRLLIGALSDTIRGTGLHPVKMTAAITMEIYSRLKASWYVRCDKGDMSLWDPIATTKDL
ncbi:MAG TPA: glycosyltransferase [Candidatus Methanomethylophilaceae archaeon]|jgi:cellulose synthase/poly-beta-1,6-N-acetylglucosamine synthase-like glycosyltransferase|nr:glycosyltransferase [Candidatus Methanomethylophilaceae archaeon]